MGRKGSDFELAARRADYAANREDRRAANRAYYAANREHKRAADRKRAEQRQAAAYLRKYGISIQQVKATLLEQRGLCAICSKNILGRALLKGTKGRLEFHADHDHKTGVFRGFLCGQCNKGLGLFRDNPAVLESAIAYLRKGA